MFGFCLLTPSPSDLPLLLFSAIPCTLNLQPLEFTQEEATATILSLIQADLRRVCIGLHTLGKEDLLVRIATTLGCRVGVEPERMEQLKLLEMPDVFEPNMEECWIRIYPSHIIAKK